MASSKKKLTKPKARPVTGPGVSIDALYRLSGLGGPSGWAGGGAAGGGTGGWSMAPGGPSGAQGWGDSFGGGGAYAASGGPTLRALAPDRGTIPVVTNIPSPNIPSPGGGRESVSPAAQPAGYYVPLGEARNEARAAAAAPAPSYKPLYQGQPISSGSVVMVGGTAGVAPHPISLGGGVNYGASSVNATTPVPKPVYTAPKPAYTGMTVPPRPVSTTVVKAVTPATRPRAI